jgi:acyl-homoserine lactone acylase PvdQ
MAQRRTGVWMAVVGCVVCLLGTPALAGAQVQPYGHDNYGEFYDVLPPGTNGLVTLPQLGAYEVNNSLRPPHSSDQLAMYSDLTTAAPNIQASQIGQYFKSSVFGVPPSVGARVETVEPGATIEWDNAYAVPHIYGDTRAELMFAIGWATAEDRLFFIDALRHAGDGTLASFAGGANVAMDESVWSSEPYTAQDLQNQVSWDEQHLPGGRQVFDDAQNYVDGINAYIAKAENPLFRASMMPSEYAAILKVDPQPFSVTDLVRIATLVGGIFGKGGGGQLGNALLYEQMLRRFGRERYDVPGSPVAVSGRHGRPVRLPRGARDRSGFGTFMSFDDPSDPEAPTTVHGKWFRYQTLPAPSRAVARTIALPDPGSVQPVNHVAAGTVPGGTVEGRARQSQALAAAIGLGAGFGALADMGRGLLAFPRSMPNALLVSARHSATGHPLAVMGPQVSYFVPEILMEEDIHGPGIDAAGAAFPGVNLYVELGHGPDYAWSATSAGQNIIDTFAVPLCDPSGGAAARDSNYYLLHGRCVAMQTLTDHESWTQNPADSTPSGSVTFTTQRTAFGIVVARATVHGRPVAYCNLRSTYMHELDSAVGFEKYNEPAQMRSPQDFFRAADAIDYTFNWFYADDKHIAYFNSGQNPVRAAHTDPLFPTWSSSAWKGFTGGPEVTPASTLEADTSLAAHPHTVDQSYLTSWNNKQAPGYNDAATNQEFSSVYRSQLLDLGIQHYLRAGHGRMTLVDLINAMGNAGTQDLRGVEVLPYALRVIGRVRGSGALASAVAALRAWVASGAHRINRAAPGASGRYQQGDAVQLMDAWWPLLVRAEFGPVLGASLLATVENDYPINDEPGHGTSGPHLGSAWDVGFYGIVQKDLRAALGLRVRGGLNRVFCGRGSLAACRRALRASLLAAAGESAEQVYPADSACKAGDQMCSDSIQFRPIGAVHQPLIEWVNRPTFQQALTITGHMP